MIIFENDGLIDEQCITVFGVSSKETEDAIGYFGTGLKYAIAILMREKQQITIYKGNDIVLRFGTTGSIIRRDKFNIITMNSDQLGFTTELGKNWKLWQAFRELYCNCVDENGKVYEADTIDNIDLTNKTIITVSGRKFEQTFYDKDSFILGTRPICTNPDVNIHPGNDNPSVFYKGIRALEVPKPTLNVYDIRQKVVLTEDRTISSSWDAFHRIKKAILKCQDKSILQQTLTCSKNYIEHEFDYQLVAQQPGETFLEVVGELSQEYNRNLNSTARKVWMNHRSPTEPEECSLTDTERMQLERAVNFCNTLGYPVDTYKIVVSEFLGEGVLGRAQNGTIYISKRTFMVGCKMVAGTLLEEYLHLKYKLVDETREMQNFLFDLIMSMGENYVLKEPL